jgi:hypothetical protein
MIRFIVTKKRLRLTVASRREKKAKMFDVV